MSGLSEWLKNRWECIDNGIDIPLLDYVVCYAIFPICALGVFILFITAPFWGIPYVIYRICFAEKRKGRENAEDERYD